MEFFIKKNSTLPLLKINVIKDGRSDYNRDMKYLEETEIFFSMVNEETNVPKITTRPAGVIKKEQSNYGVDLEYSVVYQFTPFDTKKIGRYKGQFLFKNDTGIMLLPLSQEIYINVTDSFIINDFEYRTCYVLDYPCCFGETIAPSPIPPNPPVTTTTTHMIVTTTTTIII